MKLTKSIIECEQYSIINHEDSHTPPFSLEAIKAEPLKCNLDLDDIEKCLLPVHYDLINSFDIACSGESYRFKLMSLHITKHALKLQFADLSRKDEYGALSETVVFTKPINITVYADRFGNVVPDCIMISFNGSEAPIEKGIATVEEYRNTKRYASEKLIFKDGKTILESIRFD